MTKSKHILKVYTDKLVEEMKQCYENGMTINEIAKQFHADYHAVSSHLKAKGVQIPRDNSIVGKQFGKFLVKCRDNNNNYICQCECGREVIVKHIYRSIIVKGKTDFCGCAARQAHAIRQTRLYDTWKNMRSRCYNPKNKRYQYYGGKGITICNEWQIFENFYSWSLTNGYSDDLTIDRIDNSKGYAPENCRWADAKTQANNHTDNHFLTYNGQTLTLAQWADKLGVHQTVIWKRLNRGWSIERTVTTPLRVKNNGHYIKDVSTRFC